MQSFDLPSDVIQNWLTSSHSVDRLVLWQKLSVDDKNLIWQYCEQSSKKDLETLWRLEWQSAKEYFSSPESQNQLKMSHKIGKTRHSFIQVDGEVYMLARKDQQLGAGAFGKVKPSYLRQGEGDVLNSNGEACIVKVITVNDQEDEESVKREAAALDKLGELRAKQERQLPSGKKRIYLLAKRHNGKELFDVINAGILTEAQILMIAYQCCELVNRAHQMGLLHLDIKPENFMVDMQNGKVTVALVDWGLSQSLPTIHSEVETKLMGTPGYIAPEIIANQPKATTASDVFSLGMMLKNDLLIEPKACASLLCYDANKRESLPSMQARLIKLMNDLPSSEKDESLVQFLDAHKKTLTAIKNEPTISNETPLPLSWQKNNIQVTIETFKNNRLNILMKADDLWLIKAKAYGYVLQDLENVNNRFDLDDNQKMDLIIEKLFAAENTYYGEVKEAISKELAILQWERDFNRVYDNFEEMLKTLSEEDRLFFKQAIESMLELLADLDGNRELAYADKLQELSKLLNRQLSIFNSLVTYNPKYIFICQALTNAMNRLPTVPYSVSSVTTESTMTTMHELLKSALTEVDKMAEPLLHENKNQQPDLQPLQSKESNDIAMINQLLTQCAFYEKKVQQLLTGENNDKLSTSLRVEHYHPQMIVKLQNLLAAQKKTVTALRQQQVNKHLENQLRLQLQFEKNKSSQMNINEVEILKKIEDAQRPLTLSPDIVMDSPPNQPTQAPISSPALPWLTKTPKSEMFSYLQAEAALSIPEDQVVMREEVAMQTAIAEAQFNTQRRETNEDEALSKTLQTYQDTLAQAQAQLNSKPSVDLAGLNRQLKEVMKQTTMSANNQTLSAVLSQTQQKRQQALAKLQQMNIKLDAICQDPVAAYELKEKRPERLFARKWLKHQIKNVGRTAYGKDHVRKKQLKTIQNVLLALKNEFTANNVQQLKEKSLLAYQCLAQVQKEILEENNRLPSTLFKVCGTQMQALEDILQNLHALEMPDIPKPHLTEEQFRQVTQRTAAKEVIFVQRFRALCQQYLDTPFDSTTWGASSALSMLEANIQHEREILQYFARSGSDLTKIEALKIAAQLASDPVVKRFDSKVAERAKKVEKRVQTAKSNKAVSVSHSYKQQQALISQKVALLQETYLGKAAATSFTHKPK